MITVINLEISNLNSVLNALKYLEIEFCVSDKKEEIEKATHIILPGVGTFGKGMEQLKSKGLIEPIRKQAFEKKIPVMGICLGMQLLFESSEESPGAEGLGLLKGNVIKLPKSEKYTIPRIGWAESIFKQDFLGFKNGDKTDFYYIHSFYCNPSDKNVIAIVNEDDNIACAIKENKIYGCQFHPEKSHKAGLNLLKNFAQE